VREIVNVAIYGGLTTINFYNFQIFDRIRIALYSLERQNIHTQFWASNLPTITWFYGDVERFEMEIYDSCCALRTNTYKSKAKLT